MPQAAAPILAGTRVTLRPIRLDEIDLFPQAQRGAVARERWLRRVEHSGRLVGGLLDLGIESDGRLVGDIGARGPEFAFPPGVLEVGIDLFESADRGRGLGREAVALLTTYLFEAGLAQRVQGSTAVDNVAMRRVFELLGFRLEGTMRAYMPAPGGRDDYVLYAVLRDEWPGQ